MTRGAQGLQSRFDLGGGDEDPIGIESGEGEDGDARQGEGLEERGEDAGEVEGEGSDEFEAGPTGLGLDVWRDEVGGADDGEFVGCTGDGKEGGGGGPKGEAGGWG
jgi:hypothetical protein